MSNKVRNLLVLVFCFLIMFMVGVSQIGAAPKGTLTIASNETQSGGIDPTRTTMTITACLIRPLIFDSLINQGPKGSFVPGLAISWGTVDKENKIWEFKLREGVKFHNGEVFNAQACKFTFDLLISGKPEWKAQGFMWEGIEKTEVVDDYTFRIITKEPMGPLLANIATMGCIVPLSYKLEEFAVKPIGTGPFKFVEWVRGDHTTAVANLDYWAGPPKVEKVIVYEVPEDSTRVSTSMTGEVDINSFIPGTMAKVLEALPNVNLVKVGCCSPVALCLGGGARPPIGGQDGKILRAIEYAIDRERVAKEVYNGYARPADSIHSPEVFGYYPIKWRPYDPEKAKQLLAEAGWDPNNKVEAWYVKGHFPNNDNLAVLLHSMLKEVGININIRVASDWAVGAMILNQKNYDIFFELWNNVQLDADNDLWGNYVSTSRNREGADKYARGKELEDLIKQGRNSVDPKVRLEAYKKAQEIIFEYPTRLPIVFFDAIYAVQKRVKGFEPASNAIVDFTTISVEE